MNGNGFMSWLLRSPFHGMLSNGMMLITVTGRKSGRRYSTPVQILFLDGERWLVAPYGVVAWVRNARASGEVELTRARRTERVLIEEVGPDEAAPVLREYLRDTPIVKPFFDIGSDAPLAAFAAEAPRHPVFRLTAP